MDFGKYGKRAAVFAGTSEGRAIGEFVLEKGLSAKVDFLVATGYGQEILEEEGSLMVFSGRLNEGEMEDFFSHRRISLVIDATHPYATAVTENIKAACSRAGIECVRVTRGGDEVFEGKGAENITFVNSVGEAVRAVSELGLKTLVTTGSKEIASFGEVKNASEIVVARVLPSVDSINACLKAGIMPKNIIGMQGPFTLEMNLATLRQYGCGALVTKETGKAGGFADKAECAKLGYNVIVVRKPKGETGVSLKEAKNKLWEEMK